MIMRMTFLQTPGRVPELFSNSHAAADSFQGGSSLMEKPLGGRASGQAQLENSYCRVRRRQKL
jgi:hypothetical protein